MTHPDTLQIPRAVVEQALKRAYQLGQTYWQQADSDSWTQNKKSEETQVHFNALVNKTCEALQPQAAVSKGLFIDMIAQHPGLAEELRAMDIQPTKGNQDGQQLRPEIHSVGGQQPVEGAGVSTGGGFSGSRANLVSSITALLSLDAAGCIVPYGIGGHARTLLTAAAKELQPQAAEGCGEAGCAEGRCGTTECLPSFKAKKAAAEPVKPIGFANHGQLDNIADGYAYIYPEPGVGADVALYTTPPATQAALMEALEKMKDIKICLMTANEIPIGPICDTIWYSEHETLFDFIDAAIAQIEAAGVK